MPHVKIKIVRYSIASFSAEIGTIWLDIIASYNKEKPISEAARSKVWVSGGSFAGTASSNPAGVMDVCPLWVLYVVR